MLEGMLLLVKEITMTEKKTLAVIKRKEGHTKKRRKKGNGVSLVKSWPAA